MHPQGPGGGRGRGHARSSSAPLTRAERPNLSIRPRVGTSLWLGCLDTLEVRSTVLDVHTVQRGERVGYRQGRVPRAGHVLVVAGGTSHGIGLEAPRAVEGVAGRGKAVAKGGGATGERQFNGILDVYKKTLATDGVVGLYRGFVPSVLGIIVYRGTYFGCYDSLSEWALFMTVRTEAY